jgi:hypothetical protein
MRLVFGTSVSFIPRLAALYAALFILPGIQMPFFPVWLKAKDVDATLIELLSWPYRWSPGFWRSRSSPAKPTGAMPYALS